MKTLMLVLVLVFALGQSGCAFLGGAAVGAGAAGAGYEYQAYRQMQQLEEDYKNKKISREQYEDRKKQIEAGSLIY
jgi:membrane-bound lytic murein transglycosylase B